MTLDEAHHLIKHGNSVELRKGLDAGLDPNTPYPNGTTLLMLAAVTGDTNIGRLLIERGADLDRRDMHRNTALSDAIMSGHVGFVRLLLEHGASIDCHPHGNSLAIFLEWTEEYTRVTSEQMKKIRSLLEAEKRKRGDPTNTARIS